MSRVMPQYAADFPVEAEVEIAGFIEETSDVIYANMQGGALDAALDAMQMIVTNFRSGGSGSGITAADAMRAAREIRALMHEKASLQRMCRAQAIEKLGLRPRPPMDGTRPKPAPAKAAPPAEAERFVKTPGPVETEMPVVEEATAPVDPLLVSQTRKTAEVA